MNARPTHWLAAPLLALVLSACGSTGPADAGQSPSPAPTPAAALLDCDELNLLSPQGNRVDLTGTWAGGSTLFYVRQSGQCVWWLGLSNWPGQPPGAFFSHTFAGRLGIEGPDFILRGEWATIVRPDSGIAYTPPYERPLSFEIAFETVGGAETIVLRSLTPSELETTDWYAGNLTRTGPLPQTQSP